MNGFLTCSDAFREAAFNKRAKALEDMPAKRAASAPSPPPPPEETKGEKARKRKEQQRQWELEV